MTDEAMMLTTTVYVAPTDEELLARYNARKFFDIFGFESTDYLAYLSVDTLRTVPDTKIPDGYVATVWSRDDLLKSMQDYLSFAFDKANNRRALSATRSVQHYIAWTWIAGDREFSDEVRRMLVEDYGDFGKPILRKIAEYYGWDGRSLDDETVTDG